MALFAAGLMVVAAFVTGGVIDYISLNLQKQEVQAAADASALAAANEMTVAKKDADRMLAVATLIAKGNLGNLGKVDVTVATLADNAGIEVTLTTPPRTFFPGVIGMTAGPVSASAIAEVVGSSICMIGLDVKAKRTLDMRRSAEITARNCAIYSNSTSPEGITVAGNATVDASFICSAGGVKADKKLALEPAPLEDCPPIADPLESRPPPPVGPCDHKKYKVDSKDAETLYPGVYCGGLEIKTKAKLQPGIYVIKGGPLKVNDGELSGENVGFFLTGDNALIDFEKKSVISLSGPRTGALAGLLFYEDRAVSAADGPGKPDKTDPETGLPEPKEHRIRSDDARELVGTIYIPRNKLLVDGDKPIASESAYTVIIAREFALAEGPEIVLNADYESSNVPVPNGVGNKSKKGVRLTH